jgi:CRISPR/Cas system-associated exonuclease Cas4 (RecB family)
MEYFSYSQLRTYMQCPRTYYMQYVLKRFPPKNLALQFGSSIHTALEVFYNTGNQTLAEETFIKDFSAKSVDVLLKPTENLQKEGTLGVKLLNEYFKNENKPLIKPKFVEYKFETILKHPVTGESLDVPIKGVMDIITEEGFILDHKTSASIWTMDMIDSDMQKNVYWLAYKSLFGVEPKGFGFNFLIKRVKVPKFDVQWVEVNQAQQIETVKFIQHIVNEIRRGHFPTCQNKYCKNCR